MSHMIDLSNYRENMAYVGAKPWHGLGQELTPGQPIEVWQREAGMDWEVMPSNVHYQLTNGHGMAEWPDRQVLYRSDNSAPLGLVSDRYRIVQPAEVLEFFRDLVESHGFQLETAGCLKGGAIYWALAKTGLDGQVKGDKMKSYLQVSTSCDGSNATRVGHTSVRIVCHNTLSAAISRDSREWSITSHRTTFDADGVKKQLGLHDFQKEWDTFMETCAKLSEVPIQAGQAKAFLGDVLSKGSFSKQVQKAYTNDGREAAGKVIQEMEDSRSFKSLWETYTSGQGQDTPAAKGTAFGLVNAVTRHVDHERRAKNQDTRLQNAWFGVGSELKARAFEYAQKLAA